MALQFTNFLGRYGGGAPGGLMSNQAFLSQNNSVYANRQSPGQRVARSNAYATRRANAANNRRYRQILDILRRNVADTSGSGNAELGLIRQNETQANTSGMQDLVSRGLSNTTLRPAVLARNRQTAGLLEQAARERALRARIGARGDLAGAIERREDVGPDFSSLLPLLLRGGAVGL